MVESSEYTNPFPAEPQLTHDDLQNDVKKARYQAWLDYEKAQLLANIEVDKARKLSEIEGSKTQIQSDFEREKADFANDYTLDQKLYESYLEVAKGQISQAAYRAEFIQKASAAIGSAYTAVLAFSFTLAKEGHQVLPVRGLAPTFFAGLALVLATAYIAFVTEPTSVRSKIVGGGTMGKQRAGRNTFIEWTRLAAGFNRRQLIQASVLSLGASIFFLPSAYINLPDWLIGIFAVISIFIGIYVISIRLFDSN